MDLEELIDFLTRVLPFSDRFYSVFSCAGTYCSFIITVVLGLFAVFTYKYWRYWTAGLTYKWAYLLEYRFGESRAIKRITLNDVSPINREYSTFNSGEGLEYDYLNESGFYIKGDCEAKPDNKTAIRDWKGIGYTNNGWVLEILEAEVELLGSSNQDEWKIGISLVHPGRQVPNEYRLYGEGQITYEISRHHEEGLQIVLAMFGGDPDKERRPMLKETGVNKIRMDLRGSVIKCFLDNEVIKVYDMNRKREIWGFQPNSVWFVCWMDKKGWVKAGFKNVITYWRKG